MRDKKNNTSKRVNSAEEMNQYLKVTKPSGWIVLLAVILLFVGIILWTVLGTIRVEFKTSVLVNNGSFTAFMNGNDRDKFNRDMKFQIDGKEAGFDIIYMDAVEYDQYTKSDFMDAYGVTEREFDAIAKHIGLREGDSIFTGAGSVKGVKDGLYEITILTEEIKPIELLVK